jgi:hypothetical protein
MLVLVENYRQHDPYGTDSDLLANMITNELREHAVAPVIDPNLLENLRQEQGAAFQQMRIGDIGKALKADQVLYVDLIGSRASVQPGDVIDARVVLKVKIIESATGNTLWPLDSAGGYAVNHEVRPVKSRPGVDTASVRDDMMQAAAVKVGQLFYAWKPKDMYEHDNAGQ